MANIKSQKKSIRQDVKRTERNKSVKSAVKTAIKKANTEKTAEAVNNATKLINSAVTKGVFHKNKAARLTSRVQSIEIKK